MNIRKIHSRYIKGSDYNAIVKLKVLNIACTGAPLTEIRNKRVLLSTRVLKHLYDKRTSREYDLIIKFFRKIIINPHYIYENRAKRANSYLIVRQYKAELILLVVEIFEDNIHIVTAFSTSRNYLENFKIVWNWEGGLPPS